MFVFILDSILRSVLYSVVGERMLWAYIPIKSGVVFGETSGDRRLGLIGSIFNLVAFLWYMFCLGFEIYLIKTYAIVKNNRAELYLPKNLINVSIYSKHALIFLIIICIVLRFLLTRKYCIKNKASSWLSFVWIIFPPAMYLYFIKKGINNVKRI